MRRVDLCTAEQGAPKGKLSKSVIFQFLAERRVHPVEDDRRVDPDIIVEIDPEERWSSFSAPMHAIRIA